MKNLILTCKKTYEEKLVTGKAGNISFKYDKDTIAITPTLKSLNNLNVEDIVLVKLNGDVITKGTPSSEINMHLEIYKKREDVKAIVHTHSPYATGFAFSNKKIKRLEGFGKIEKEYLNELEYFKPGSDELAKNAAIAIENEDVLILKNHGVIAVGENLEEASSLARFVEDTAKTQFITHMLII